jgi:hypothetical protein
VFLQLVLVLALLVQLEQLALALVRLVPLDLLLAEQVELAQQALELALPLDLLLAVVLVFDRPLKNITSHRPSKFCLTCRTKWGLYIDFIYIYHN